MADYYPNPTQHVWDDLVVGGSSGNPIIATLDEENDITNGYFKDTIANWDGTVTRTALDSAMRGSYVMQVDGGDYAHQDLALTDAFIAFTGFVKFAAGATSCEVYIYPSSSTARIASPSEYFKLTLTAGAGNIVVGDWCPFYMIVETGDWAAFTHLHFEFRQTGGSVYIDDLRVHAVNSIIALEDPNVLKLRWQRKVDAEYELENGEIKTFQRGWRPIYELGYQYCSRAQLLNAINISENMFCLFIPNDDSLSRHYIRMTNDFDSSYFKDRFVGHSQNLELTSIFLQKYKNKQYGNNYFAEAYA